MTKKSERELLLMEVKARKEVIAKIKNPLKRLKKQADEKLQVRKAKIAASQEYDSIEDAHEIWGYGGITDEEFEEIKKVLEEGEKYIENHISPQEYGVRILEDFLARLYSEINSFEFDLRQLRDSTHNT